ncbi:hypothetical protein [Amycolatopsis sp. EV170708-02-1]|uniref:hypothetical protein n=1 Tax=Amycolatopsis sp. EV170708-02-1 TaxID=2919322 RepID=UPI001F0CD900|nr:hypothetical protein [Amycolatopsis sp. EV170708-02-1]UMP06988.1 hypothetical protein MJQ72_20200 [Amycolatopsis sp. EV170708-02-1]
MPTRISTGRPDAATGGHGGHNAISHIRYDLRRFQVGTDNWVREFTVPIDVVSSPESVTTPALRERVREVQALIDTHINTRHRLGNGDQVHITLEPATSGKRTDGWIHDPSSPVQVEMYDSGGNPSAAGIPHPRWDINEPASKSTETLLGLLGISGTRQTPTPGQHPLTLTPQDLAALEASSGAAEGAVARELTDTVHQPRKATRLHLAGSDDDLHSASRGGPATRLGGRVPDSLPPGAREPSAPEGADRVEDFNPEGLPLTEVSRETRRLLDRAPEYPRGRLLQLPRFAPLDAAEVKTTPDGQDLSRARKPKHLLHDRPVVVRAKFAVRRVLSPDEGPLTEVTVRILLDPENEFGAIVQNAEWIDLLEGTDKYYNRPRHRLPNGDLFRVRYVRVTDRNEAHHVVTLKETGTSKQTSWRIGDKEKVHEAGHMFGWRDEKGEFGAPDLENTVMGRHHDESGNQLPGDLTFRYHHWSILAQHIGEIPLYTGADAKYAEALGMMERHLAALPVYYQPEWREQIAEWALDLGQGLADNLDAQTLSDRLAEIDSMIEHTRVTRATVMRNLYEQAMESVAHGQAPVTFLPGGVPGGVNSHDAVGFVIAINFDPRAQLGYLLERLRREGHISDYNRRHGVLPPDDDQVLDVFGDDWVFTYRETISNGRLIELRSPYLQGNFSDHAFNNWEGIDEVLRAMFEGGVPLGDGGWRILVSPRGELSPQENLRLTELMTAFSPVVYHLANHLRGANMNGTRQRDLAFARINPLPVDPTLLSHVDQVTMTNEYFANLLSDDGHAIVLEDPQAAPSGPIFQLFPGTHNSAVLQVYLELAGAMTLAAKNPAIDAVLHRALADPPRLGKDIPGLPELLRFLELLPVSPAVEERIVQLFAWTKPWADNGTNDRLLLTQSVSTSYGGVYFPLPGMTMAAAVAVAERLPQYEEVDLVMARATENLEEIQLWNGPTIRGWEFVRRIVDRGIGLGKPLVLAISGAVRGAWPRFAVPDWLSWLVAEIGRDGRWVIVPANDLFMTPDKRLMTGRIVAGRFQPDPVGWVALQDRAGPRATRKADLTESLISLGLPAEVYPHTAKAPQDLSVAPLPPGASEPAAPEPGPSSRQARRQEVPRSVNPRSRP